MRKQTTARSHKPPAPVVQNAKVRPAANPAFNKQMRKVLLKHYRAKYGVR